MQGAELDGISRAAAQWVCRIPYMRGHGVLLSFAQRKLLRFAAMQSIYQRALGSEFSKLHPQLQKRFSLHSASGLATIGSGVMERLWRGPAHTLPFLYLGVWRGIHFPEHATDVHFNVQNYAYLDCLGRETVSWVRKFATTRVRRFDAYMVYSEERGCLVHYLGSHQHLAAELSARVTENGGVRFVSGKQHVYEGAVGARLPLLFSGNADVCEWYDDAQQCFRVEMSAANTLWGKLFGYSGRFQVEWTPVPPNYVPDSILPKRVERRT